MNAASKQCDPGPGYLDAAVEQAIEACGGDAREPESLAGGEWLAMQLQELRSKVFQGRANARTSQMSDVTYYVALPFVFSEDGVAAGEAAECLSANAAVMRAEALSHKPGHAGAIAFSRTGDPSSGDFNDAKMIRKFGDVPDDLSTL
ncbi:hypothetical protein ACVWZ6_001481 [Bradyrhizobium sp. GM6.1]